MSDSSSVHRDSGNGSRVAFLLRMSREEPLLTSVILAPDEAGEILGRVLDDAIVALHAQMQRGEVSTEYFGQRLMELRFLRDEIISRAEAGETLPNGHRLCYFTPDNLEFLRTAFAAVLADSRETSVPTELLQRLNEKFLRAGAALDHQQHTNRRWWHRLRRRRSRQAAPNRMPGQPGAPTPPGRSSTSLLRRLAELLPSPMRVRRDLLADLRKCSAAELEQVATELLRHWGFVKEQSWPTADGGFEMLVRRGDQYALAHYFAGTGSVTKSMVQDLFERLKARRLVRGYLFTTAVSSRSMIGLARRRGIELLDGPTWIQRLREVRLEGTL